MKTQAETLIKNLKQKIEQFDATPEIYEVGTIVSVSDGIVKISGLSKCQSSEMVAFDAGGMGLINFILSRALERGKGRLKSLKVSNVCNFNFLKLTGQTISMPVDTPIKATFE